MGSSGSKLEKALVDLPEGERYFGLENYGNTCYANSVLQSLYFCTQFRERILALDTSRFAEENLLTSLADLYQQVHAHKKKTGVCGPKKFIQRLRKDNEQFSNVMHQDAHEFLNFLLNEMCELLEKQAKEMAPPTPPMSPPQPPPKTWVHDMFGGVLVNQTRCLCCECVSSREEAFLDLSLEIEQNSSLTSCIRNFSATEMLDKDDKFDCEMCGCKQEAQKCMKVKELPQVLVCHLKRFKYDKMGRMRKLVYRVSFPEQLKLCNTAEPAGADTVFQLFSVVVHVGSGLNHGHYISLVRSHKRWLVFDDENVAPIPESKLQNTFGSTQEYAGTSDHHGYILFYEQQAR